MNKNSNDGGIDLEERTTEKLKRPPMYVVFVHNDPFTTREFVVEVLKRFFSKTMEQSVKIMMTAHTQGMAQVSIFTKEIAETKCAAVNAYCRAEGKPLTFSVQEE